MSEEFSLQTIGRIHSPYKEKFGIPRQPGLAPSLVSRIRLEKAFASSECVRGLEQCSHIWLVFIFSESVAAGWNPTVRPPRLGGNKRMGVFATRSPFRPNPLGLSAVKLIAIEQNKQGIELVISGADLLDGTPILDIKPYLPYSDSIDDAECGFAEQIELLAQPVSFSAQAEAAIEQLNTELNQPVKQQIIELLRCDPRPAYKKQEHSREYGVKLHNANIRFQVLENEIRVTSIEFIFP